MTEWVRGFVISDVADVHVKFAEAITAAEQLDLLARRGIFEGSATATLVRLKRAYADFNAGLRRAADDGARDAIKGMVERLDSTAVRPDTGSTPHLRDLLYARRLSYRGLETGAVGVADVQRLERAINPHSPGYGPYWRAQEYGTGGIVPSQLGRVIKGVFTGPGGSDPTPPRAEFSGGGGPHSVFLAQRPVYSSSAEKAGLGVNSRGVRSGGAGFGTIAHEIHARHFIALGADAAAVAWRAEIARVQSRAIDELVGILG